MPAPAAAGQLPRTLTRPTKRHQARVYTYTRFGRAVPTDPDRLRIGDMLLVDGGHYRITDMVVTIRGRVIHLDGREPVVLRAANLFRGSLVGNNTSVLTTPLPRRPARQDDEGCLQCGTLIGECLDPWHGMAPT